MCVRRASGAGLPGLVFVATVTSLAALASPRVARADDAADEEAERKKLETWLAEEPAQADVTQTPEAPEAPPPPPRHRGLLVEGSVGALGQLGALQHVSRTAPWFHLGLGYEVTHWFTVLAETDITVASTSLANPPPEPRGYTLFGFSGAGRFSWEVSPVVSLFAEGEVGLAEVSSDILTTYGFNDANSLEPYFGGALGAEWFQVNPHYALGVRAGVRSYGALLDRSFGGDTALAWLGAATLRYTF